MPGLVRTQNDLRELAIHRAEQRGGEPVISKKVPPKALGKAGQPREFMKLRLWEMNWFIGDTD